MTGIPDFNYPAFAAAKELLEAAGHIVESPHLVPAQGSWEGYMRADLPLLCKCDTIAMLPGWESSRGALLERHVSDAMGNAVLLIVDGEIIPQELDSLQTVEYHSSIASARSNHG